MGSRKLISKRSMNCCPPKDFYFFHQFSQSRWQIILLKCLFGVTVNFCYFYQHSYMILVSYHFYRMGLIDWSFVTMIATCFTASVSCVIWWLNQNSFLELNDGLNYYVKNFHDDVKEGEDGKKPNAKIHVVCGFGCLFLSVLMVLVVSQFETYQSRKDDWIETICFGSCNATLLSDDLKTKIIALDQVFYTLGTVGCGATIQVGYVFHIKTITWFLDEAKNKMARKANEAETQGCVNEAQLSREDITDCRKRVKIIKNFVALSNKMYSTIFFLWYGVCLIGTCQFTSEMINNFQRISPTTLAMYCVIYGQSFIWIIIISHVSSQIPEKMSKCQQLVSELTIFHRHIPCEVFGELNILLHQMNSPPQGMTVGGCFVITRSLFLSYVGVIVTYVFFILQMGPDVLKNIGDRQG